MSLDTLTSRHALAQTLIDALRLEGQEPTSNTREAMHRYIEGAIGLNEMLSVVQAQLKA